MRTVPESRGGRLGSRGRSAAAPFSISRIPEITFQTAERERGRPACISKGTFQRCRARKLEAIVFGGTQSRAENANKLSKAAVALGPPSPLVLNRRFDSDCMHG
jgi:hypothetical protein